MCSYLILCLLSVLTGFGILSFSQFRLPSPSQLFVSPILTLVFWTSFIYYGTLLHFTISQLCVVGWPVTLLLSLIGIRYLYQCCQSEIVFKDLKISTGLSILAIALPILVMLPYFSHKFLHFFGSLQSDKFFYVAIGKYLWNFPKGTLDHLSLYYQIALIDTNIRFIPGAFLAFLSPLTGEPGNIILVPNLLLAWCLFLFASSCAFVPTSFSLNKMRYIYLVFIMLSIVIYCPLIWNNYPNLIVLSIFPVLAGLVPLLQFNHKNEMFIQALLASLLLQTLIFNYVEMLPFLLMSLGILLISHCQRLGIKKTSYFMLLVTVLTGILVLPDIKHLIWFFNGQIHSSLIVAKSKYHPGPIVTALDSNVLTALNTFLGWKLLLLVGAVFIAVIMLSALGARRLWHNNKELIIALLCLLLFVPFMLKAHYSYGAYKVVLFSWWLIGFVVIVGANEAYHYLFRDKYAWRGVLPLCVILWGSINLFASWHLLKKSQYHFVNQQPFSNHYMEPLSDINEIYSITGGKPVIINVNNAILDLWATYVLMDMPTYITNNFFLADNVAYSASISRFISNDSSHGKYVLTDSVNTYDKKKLMWSNKFYYLWKC